MSISRRTVFAITFVAGALSGSVATMLLSPRDANLSSGVQQVTDMPNDRLPNQQAQPGKALASRNSIVQPFSSSAVTGETTNAFSDIDCRTTLQQESMEEVNTLDESSFTTALNLDPALQEERYISAETAYEKEQTLIHQEAIIVMEEEATLYELPPESNMLSAEEQDKLEQENAITSIYNSDSNSEIAFQHILDKEAELNEIYKEQDVITVKSDGEHE
jgi:hypothetical protein